MAGQTFLQPGQNKKVLRHGFDGSPPDLLITATNVSSGGSFSRRASNPSGSTLSAIHNPGTVMAGPVLGGKKGFLQGARAQSRSAYAQYQHMAKTMQKFRMSVQLPAQLLREGQSQKREFRQGTFQRAAYGSVAATAFLPPPDGHETPGLFAGAEKDGQACDQSRVRFDMGPPKAPSSFKVEALPSCRHGQGLALFGRRLVATIRPAPPPRSFDSGLQANSAARIRVNASINTSSATA